MSGKYRKLLEKYRLPYKKIWELKKIRNKAIFEGDEELVDITSKLITTEYQKMALILVVIAIFVTINIFFAQAII